MAAVETESDQALLDSYRNGDIDAFERIYSRYAQMVLAYLIGIVMDRERAEEVLQETFISFARQAAGSLDTTNIRAYLFKAARHKALNLARSEQRRTRFAGDYELFVRMRRGPDHRDTPSVLADEEMRHRLNRALCRLKDSEREVVLLHTHGGLTFREVAAVVDAPQGTVATRYRSALNSLRRLLGATDG